MTKDNEPPEWFDRSKVTGPIWEPDGELTFRCSDHVAGHGCAQREADGIRPSCHSEVAFGMHIIAAISEGYCPWHENCRLEQVDLFKMNILPIRLGPEAHGRCRRDGRVWVTGTDDKGRQWWEWNLYDPPRKTHSELWPW